LKIISLHREQSKIYILTFRLIFASQSVEISSKTESANLQREVISTAFSREESVYYLKKGNHQVNKNDDSNLYKC